MRLIWVLLLLTAPAFSQEYWTHRRVVETTAVTALHMFDAAQTCYHMKTDNWTERSPITPHNCVGATFAIIGEGTLAQYASYRLARRYQWWRPIDRALPYVQIGISVNAIQCSYRNTCSANGF